MTGGSALLTRYLRDVDAVFDLLGDDENDLTAAFGFVLARSHRLRRGVLEALSLPHHEPTIVRLETPDRLGRTDLEVENDRSLLIIEAKKGWNLPHKEQLERYAERLVASRKDSTLLVTLSDCSQAYADLMLPATDLGVPVRHLPWSQVKDLLAAARAQTRGRENFWLGELDRYLRKAVRVRTISDSWVLCVVLSGDKRPGGGGARTFRDFVVDEGVYFHPLDMKWPPTPPNFMAFRWGNKVHQIRRVIGYEIVGSVQEKWPDVPSDEETSRPHAFYGLGPPIPLAAPIPVGPKGSNYRSSRPWVLLDQLLTAATLKEAIESSKALRNASPYN